MHAPRSIRLEFLRCCLLYPRDLFNLIAFFFFFLFLFYFILPRRTWYFVCWQFDFGPNGLNWQTHRVCLYSRKFYFICLPFLIYLYSPFFPLSHLYDNIKNNRISNNIFNTFHLIYCFFLYIFFLISTDHLLNQLISKNFYSFLSHEI